MNDRVRGETMTVQEKIIDIITRYYRGNCLAIPSDEIARTLDRVGYPISPEEVQRMIGDIRREKKALIGSCSAGFFLIVTEEDMAITQAYIKNRIGPIVQAAKALDEMWGEKHGERYSGDLFSGK